MATVIEHFGQLPALFTAPRAIVLVSVPWSPWPRKSRDVLGALEGCVKLFLPDVPVAFFDLWPERDNELNLWYERFCAEHASRFALHGHGYGPLWWLAKGEVLDCLTRPYESPLAEIKQRSQAVFHSAVDCADPGAAADRPGG